MYCDLATNEGQLPCLAWLLLFNHLRLIVVLVRILASQSGNTMPKATSH
jgi:hypothetical protein